MIAIIFTLFLFFYIFHIYTGPKFTKPTITQNPDLHKLKFTQLRFTHTKILAYPNLHQTFYTTKIYTKPEFTQPNFVSCAATPLFAARGKRLQGRSLFGTNQGLINL